MHNTPHVAPENKYARTSVYHRVVRSPTIKHFSETKRHCANFIKTQLQQYFHISTISQLQQTSQKSSHIRAPYVAASRCSVVFNFLLWKFTNFRLHFSQTCFNRFLSTTWNCSYWIYICVSQVWIRFPLTFSGIFEDQHGVPAESWPTFRPARVGL